MSEDTVDIRFGGSVEGFNAATKEVTEQLKSVLSPVTELKENFAELTEVIAAAFAIEKIVDWIGEVTEAGAQVEHLSQQLGMSAEKISIFALEAKAMGVGIDGAAHAMERLERNMVQAESGTGPAAAAFKTLGLSVTDSSGHMKTLDQMLPEIADKFAATANGPTKTATAIALFGRAGADMIPMLNQGSAGLEKFKQVANDTGSVITDSMAEGMEKTAIQSATLGKAFEGVGLTLYEALKPEIDVTINGLISLVESFNKAAKGPTLLHDVLIILLAAFDSIAAAITIVSGTLEQLWQVFMETVEVFNVGGRTIGHILADAFTGHWAEIETDFAAGMDRMHEIMQERGKKMMEAGKETADAIREEFSNLGKAEAEGDGAEKPDMPDPGKNGGGDKSRVSAWRDQLDQKLMAEKNYFADSKSEELAFWQAKLGLTTQGSQEQLAVERNIYTLSRDMARAAKTEKEAIAKDDANTALTYGKSQLQAERDQLDAQVDAHKITAAQKIAILKELSQEEYQLDLQSLQNEMATLTPRTAAYEKVFNEILLLKQKNVTSMAALDRQAADAQKQQLAKMTADWEKALSPISSAFDQSVKGMIQGTTTLKNAVANLGTSILASIVDSIEKSVEKWAAGELAKTAATQGGVLARISAWLFGDTTAAVDSTANALAQIHAAGGVTYANAFAALAATPIIGPAIAPAGAAAAEATMLSVALPQAHAAGGVWSLPTDMTIRAHAQEMIMPASIAAPMRNFFQNGGQAGNDNQGGDTYHLHINAYGRLSAADIQDFGTQVVSHIQKADRTGRFNAMKRG